MQESSEVAGLIYVMCRMHVCAYGCVHMCVCVHAYAAVHVFTINNLTNKYVDKVT